MTIVQTLSVSTVLAAALSAAAQQASQPELKIDSTNRTLTVTANETVSVEPDVAILHIGFETADQRRQNRLRRWCSYFKRHRECHQASWDS